MISSSDRRTQRRLRAAEGYVELQMFDHALRELRAISDVNEVALEYHLLKSKALQGLEDWAAALEELQCYHAIQADDADVLLGLAWCYKRTGQLSQAIATMHDALKAHPHEPIFPYNLSCYYALAGRLNSALSWLGRALRMQPKLRELIDDETDFDRIRHAPEFQKLLQLSR